MIKKIQTLILSATLLLPAVVSAQYNLIPQNPGLPGNGINNNSLTIYGSILGIIQILLQIVGLVAVAFLVYGGFRYVISGGDEKATESAKKIVTNAVIGLVIVLLSYVIIEVVITTVLNGRAT